MLAKVFTYTLHGIEAIPVQVEVDLANCTFPSLTVVGLPDIAVRESRERIVSALRNQGYKFPDKRITVNLAPAELPKGGAGFDLPIAIGLLIASAQAPPEYVSHCVWAGELSLEGRIQPIRGALSMAISECNHPRDKPRILVLPKGNGTEAAAVESVPVLEAAKLSDVMEILFKGPDLSQSCTGSVFQSMAPASITSDLSEVRGQAIARRGLEVAAAGGHNLLLIGSPGTGKSMLAERLPGILPPLTMAERLEATSVHSAAGLLAPGTGLLTERPFRAPHHSISSIGLIGGGRPPKPGEISLAHRGILFLDELPEFSRSALEALRQPIENGQVTITRAGYSLTLPSRFQFIAAMNPCPCGRRLDPRGGCRCTVHACERYLGRISGPLMDRIDIQLETTAVGFAEITELRPSESSLSIRSRVLAACDRQSHRFLNHPRINSNAQMGLQEIRTFCPLKNSSLGLLRLAVSRLGLSPRAFHRIQRLARTIADLAEAEEIGEVHVGEAISYRQLDRGIGSSLGC